MTARKIFLAVLHAAVVSVVGVAYAQGDEVGAPPVALKGYDVVSYFQNGKAAVGSPTFREDWDDAVYQFSNAAHQALFAKSPDRYAPQFAGFCATGISKGKKVVADPTMWKIVDGKLYVFYSAKALDMAEKDPGLLSRSQENWESLK